MAIRHHPSPEIREFLVFYLLERASEEPFPPGRLGAEVVRLSDGDLQPADEDVRAAQDICSERGWLDSAGPDAGAPVSASSAGRAELARRTEAERSRSAGADPRRDAAAQIVRLLSPPTREEVLDVGTGGGFLAKMLATAGFSVLGIDIDRSAIERAAGEAESEARLRFEVADVHSLPTRTQRWRTIVTSHLLHECGDPVGVLRAIGACLEPGGVFACTDFAPNSAAYVLRAGRTRFHPFRALAEGDWRALAPELGLSLVALECLSYVSVVLARKEA
jgi:SAM-dependent methyltransferase